MPGLPGGTSPAARGGQAGYFAQSIRRSGATQVFVPSAGSGCRRSSGLITFDVAHPDTGVP